MTERDRVIKGLECCQYVSRSHCDECPYNYGGMCYTNDCVADLTSDAFALLLKEWEPVKPKSVPKTKYFWGCGACGEPFDRIVKFCPECGRPVKLDG